MNALQRAQQLAIMSLEPSAITYVDGTELKTKYGQWTVTSKPYNPKNKPLSVKVICSCGRKGAVYVSSLTSGHTKKCKPCSNRQSARIMESRHATCIKRT